MFRLRWYAGSWRYDKDKGNRPWSYLLMFTRPRYSCLHRSRRLGLLCLRERTFGGWCGLHNSMCQHHEDDAARCDGQLRDFDKPKERQ